MNYEWTEVKPGQSVGMMQGYALNLLANKYHPQKLEMGFVPSQRKEIAETLGYRLTMPDGKQVVYADYGDCLELVDA